MRQWMWLSLLKTGKACNATWTMISAYLMALSIVQLLITLLEPKNIKITEYLVLVLISQLHKQSYMCTALCKSCNGTAGKRCFGRRFHFIRQRTRGIHIIQISLMPQIIVYWIRLVMKWEELMGNFYLNLFGLWRMEITHKSGNNHPTLLQEKSLES